MSQNIIDKARDAKKWWIDGERGLWNNAAKPLRRFGGNPSINTLSELYNDKEALTALNNLPVRAHTYVAGKIGNRNYVELLNHLLQKPNSYGDNGLVHTAAMANWVSGYNQQKTNADRLRYLRDKNPSNLSWYKYMNQLVYSTDNRSQVPRYEFIGQLNPPMGKQLNQLKRLNTAVNHLSLLEAAHRANTEPMTSILFSPAAQRLKLYQDLSSITADKNHPLIRDRILSGEDFKKIQGRLPWLNLWNNLTNAWFNWGGNYGMPRTFDKNK